MLIAAGLPVLNVANGTERNHQPDESVTVEALERMLDVTLALVRAQRRPDVDFERIDSEEIWQGHIGGVRVDTFRYADGGEAKREVVTHPGAVTILPFDGERIWLVRQPREPVGEHDLLELPAGKIDKPGEELDDAGAARAGGGDRQGRPPMRHLVSFYNSPGLLTEEHHLFLATDLYDGARLRRGRADRDRDAARGRPGRRRSRRSRTPRR